MKKYENPEIKITVFSSDDVITASGDYQPVNILPALFEEPEIMN